VGWLFIQLSTSPPLRPLAPLASEWASNRAIRRSGNRRAKWYAAEVPVKPPPTIATSQSKSPWSGGPGRYGERWFRAAHQTERLS